MRDMVERNMGVTFGALEKAAIYLNAHLDILGNEEN